MKREQKTTFGAIRWDAWYPNTTDPNDAGFQVARSLSPAKYHFRAPFFAEIVDENKLIIPEYTQEIFDKEMEYAMDAGIDYFAYVWYSGEGLRKARDFHLTSKYKNEVKMCACLDGNSIMHDYAHEELLKLFKDELYFKLSDGRPVMYYFGTADNHGKICDDIKFFRTECEKQGIPTPYTVLMGAGPDAAKKIDADAVSRYAIGASNNISFNDVMERAYTLWENNSREGEPIGIDNVPPMTSGWNPQPRYDHPVTWMYVGNNSWAQYATAEEIAGHYKKVKEFLNDPKNFASTKANTCIIYAWNEHDEGGWICPTLKVDENGNQLYSSDGKKMINTDRIEAIKKVLKN